MADDTPVAPDVLAMLRSLAQDSCDLDPLVTDLQASFDELDPLGPCGPQSSAIDAKYRGVVKRLDSAIRMGQRCLSLLGGGSPPISGAPSALPSRSPSVAYMQPPVSGVFDGFLTRELPLVGIPYPPLCGPLPLRPGQRLPLGAFVASRVDELWALCFVVAADDLGYMLCDAEGESLASFRVGCGDAIPLPTSLPMYHTCHVEHGAGARVLALWPEGSLWTSVFYEAEVCRPPSATGNAYTLRFLQDGIMRPHRIPAKYVIASTPQGE